jgi:predicted transglutaminase-like cysteine proteinase
VDSLQKDCVDLAAIQKLCAKYDLNKTGMGSSMSLRSKAILNLALVSAMIAGFGAAAATAASAPPPLHVSVGAGTRAPIGWVEFCNENPKECVSDSASPRDVVLTAKAWKDLQRVNRWVNETIKPMTDAEHWGVLERWSYPDDGRGDCEDYVLLKRRMLVDAGWPRDALLITVVRDHKGEGHAVLTVKTNRGDFILDNQAEAILIWSETGYRFVKRQSQSDPNVWVALGDPRPANSTAAAKR